MIRRLLDAILEWRRERINRINEMSSARFFLECSHWDARNEVCCREICVCTTDENVAVLDYGHMADGYARQIDAALKLGEYK